MATRGESGDVSAPTNRLLTAENETELMSVASDLTGGEVYKRSVSGPFRGL
jgi:hypothetical protein